MKLKKRNHNLNTRLNRMIEINTFIIIMNNLKKITNSTNNGKSCMQKKLNNNKQTYMKLIAFSSKTVGTQ